MFIINSFYMGLSMMTRIIIWVIEADTLRDLHNSSYNCFIMIHSKYFQLQQNMLNSSLHKFWTYATGRDMTGEERRRQTLCDKRDNNFVWNNFSPNFNFLQTDLFVKDQKTLMLVKITTKHASNSLVAFVTHTASDLPSSSSCRPVA